MEIMPVKHGQLVRAGRYRVTLCTLKKPYEGFDVRYGFFGVMLTADVSDLRLPVAEKLRYSLMTSVGMPTAMGEFEVSQDFYVSLISWLNVSDSLGSIDSAYLTAYLERV